MSCVQLSEGVFLRGFPPWLVVPVGHSWQRPIRIWLVNSYSHLQGLGEPGGQQGAHCSPYDSHGRSGGREQPGGGRSGRAKQGGRGCRTAQEGQPCVHC